MYIELEESQYIPNTTSILLKGEYVKSIKELKTVKELLLI